jgi:hypothetical protein
MTGTGRVIGALLAAVAVLVLAAGSVASASRGSGSRLCVVHKCRVLLETTKLSVFRATTRNLGREEFESTFVRWRSTGKRTALGDYVMAEDFAGVGRLASSGSFLVYGLQSGGSQPGTISRICRLNAASGRRECFALTPGGEHSKYPSKSGGIRAVAVTPSGSIAWIVGGSWKTPTILHVVELVAGSRTSSVLASGPAIDPSSLAGVPGHLYWSEGTTARQAVIP